MKPERRTNPRISLGALAYITFESNCGGIVVNISDQGLCFHTIAPVERNDTIRFWFSAGGRQIEAHGQLIWTDATRKTGGLRFNTLSAEASQQIRRWIVQSSEPFAAERRAAPVPPSRGVVRSGVNAAQKSAVRGSAALRKLSRSIGTLARWGEFSRGLATGILIAVVVAALFLFHSYKHRIGESLILLGERFGATPHSEPASPAPTSASPQAAGPTVQRHATTPAPALAATPFPFSGPEKTLVQPPTKAAKSTQAKLEPKALVPAISLTPSTEVLPPIDLAAARPGPPPPDPDGMAQPESTGRSADKTVMAVKPAGDSRENTEDIAEINSGVPFGRYFHVGTFKDELGARSTTDDLARIGIHAIMIPKHRLWMNSYQVIAGPYRDAAEMQTAGTDLRSHGFKTHSLPRRSRDLTLVSSTAPHGSAEAAAEQLVVNWETYSPEATVSFVKAGDTLAKAQGKWVRSIPYDYDAIVYNQNGDGSRTLLEIRFRGMNRAVELSTLPSHPIIF